MDGMDIEQQPASHARKTSRKRNMRIAILIVGLILTATSVTCTALQFLSPAVGTSLSTALPIVVALVTWLYPFPSDTVNTDDPPEIIPPITQPIPSIAPPTGAEQPQTIFHIPYRQNPFFTGREQLLEQLHNNLTARKAAALTQAQAINGLGGIGKTQVAIEYAYRQRDFYPYIFWVNADKRETLIADYVGIAKLLHLPEQNEQDQNIIVTAVIAWLATHNDCLLILDNADDLPMIDPFVPTANTCHILITTRAQATNALAQSIEVEKMAMPEGTLMLLRRANVLATDATLDQATQEDKETAEKIVIALDGLPLALDQAGAYIEETACSLSAYLQAYQHRQTDLLKRRGDNNMYHSDPVAATWSLSFEQVEQHNLLAADLMRCCAFLAPDDIPEELFTEGASELSSLLQPLATDPSLLDEAIGALRCFSLVRRNPNTSTFSIHRLVQAILKINMNEATQKLWAERAVRIVNHVFPADIDVTNWKQCQRYVAHAQTCATFIEEYDLTFPEAALLLNQTACYLYEVASYTKAEPLYQRALRIREQVEGADHPNTATSLNNLAELYKIQGKYEQAEPLYQRTIAISEKTLGSHPSHLATSLNNLAGLYRRQGKYEQAEPLYQRAIAIDEETLDSNHPNLARDLNNLGGLYYSQGKYEQAELFYRRALRVREQILGSEHPDTAISLYCLAELYKIQGKYEQAEPLYQRALQIMEKRLGTNHPSTVTIRENYALLLVNKRQRNEGKPHG